MNSLVDVCIRMTMQYGCVALFEDTHISERRSVGSID